MSFMDKIKVAAMVVILLGACVVEDPVQDQQTASQLALKD